MNTSLRKGSLCGSPFSAICGVVSLDDQAQTTCEVEAMATTYAAPARGRPAIYSRHAAAFGGISLPLTPQDRLVNQPRTACDGRIDFIFAGRLDYRDELSRSLGLSLHEASAMADGTLALRAYEKWGVESFSRLLGAWTIAAWNAQTRHLVLARDPMGGRSLFYHCHGALVSFSSSIAALLNLPRIDTALDEATLGDLLLLTMGERDRTYYRDIKRVPGGHIVAFTPEKNEVIAFWQPTEAPELHFQSDHEYVEAARELLDCAVAENLRSDAPLAVMGSGGLDSAGIAATAAQMLNPKILRQYCRVPPNNWQGPVPASFYPDERPKLRALAQQHPNLEIISLEDAGLHQLDHDPGDLFQRYRTPVIGADNLGWLLGTLDQARQDGYRILLGGNFGNDTLSSGGIAAPWELLCDMRFGALAEELAGWRRQHGWSWPLTIKNTLLARAQPAWLRQWRKALHKNETGYRRWSLAKADFIKEAQLMERARALGGVIFGAPGSTSRERRGGCHRWAGWLLGDFWSQSVAVDGFEMRSPLGDLRLVELCQRMPVTQFCRNGVTRWLARRVLADRLPSEIINEQRVGAQNPEWFDRHSQLRAANAALLPRLARSDVVARTINLARAKKLLETWPENAEIANSEQESYRLALGRGLHVARFIHWSEGGN